MNVHIRFIATFSAGLALASLAGCGPDRSLQYDLELSKCNGVGFDVTPYETAELEHYVQRASRQPLKHFSYGYRPLFKKSFEF